MPLIATIHISEPDATEVLVLLHGPDGKQMNVWCELPDEIATNDPAREVQVHGHTPKTAAEFMALVRAFFGIDPLSSAQ